MSLDVGQIGRIAADLMDNIADDYGEDAEVGVVAVVVEVATEDWSTVEYRCSDGRRWIQRALFNEAIKATSESESESESDE